MRQFSYLGLQGVQNTSSRKNPKHSDTRNINFAVVTLDFEHDGFTIEKKGVDLIQTGPLGVV